MNKDQLKGAAKQVGGEIREQTGKLTGDKSTRAKGHAKQAEGKLQQGWGDTKEKARQSEAERKAQGGRNMDSGR